MSTFAKDLTHKIRLNPMFWSDLECIWSKGISSLITGMQSKVDNNSDEIANALSRQIRSASIFAKSSMEKDRVLAQNMAVYASLATNEVIPKQAALDILSELGNHPGHEKLSSVLNIGAENFNSFLRNDLLRKLNTVEISNQDFALTDFQFRLWEELPKNNVTAISAPTSAGKSFVILEHLYRSILSADTINAVFIAPTRALLAEVYGKMSVRLEKEESHIRISTIPTIDSDPTRKQLFILTQERLQALLSVWDGAFDLVITDETQAIGDGSRGMILQDCLEIVKSRNDKAKFLFLAPGAVGFENFNDILDVVTIKVEDTQLSPVVQNRIIVKSSSNNETALELSLLAENKSIILGKMESERGFANTKTRLAAVALDLGSDGGSLVYGTGPADAEKKAGQIASDIDKEKENLKELSDFIKKHVHKRYSLASHVMKGVGFHYGKMPSLLREAIEEAFKSKDLDFLVCTTTLFQGINLPARNVFIDTPTRGRGDALDPASLWNFAGRAGRLGLDIVGNVFLVDYDEWEEKPLTERESFSISPSFKKVLIDDYDEVIEKLSGEKSEENPFQNYTPSDAASGFLISKLVKGRLESYINKSVKDSLSEDQCQEIIQKTIDAKDELQLPEDALLNNWTVNPFGQARLLTRFREVIATGDFLGLIPQNPTENVYSNYVAVFSRINKYILGKNTRKYANKLTGTSLGWMRGKPLPQLIKEKIKYEGKDEGSVVNIDSEVRNVFDFVEQILRFKYVQLGKAYIDLLKYALEEAGEHEAAKSIYNFPLALELGVCSVAGQAFIELGLSRITAAVLENLIPDSNPTVKKAKSWLQGLNGNEFNLSQVIVDELKRKELVSFQ